MTDSPSDGREALRLHLLVLRCQAGDERAFARLIDRYADRTLRYLGGLVGDGAEDVNQEVWLTVYRRIATLTDPRRFRTWLYRTTRHHAIDFLRAQRRERDLFDDAGEAEDLPAAAGALDPAPDLPTLDALLRDLAPMHREVLLLRYRDELSYAEIAIVAGCSVGTVRSRLHYATRRLRDHHAHVTAPLQRSADPTTRGVL
ncbi:MAG: RNA polymerase sigma factor [Gemmatimonadaceae bacterium]